MTILDENAKSANGALKAGRGDLFLLTGIMRFQPYGLYSLSANIDTMEKTTRSHSWS